MDILKRYFFLILGSFLLAFTYNLLILPNNLVTGGAAGLGVVFQDVINPSLLLLIINIVLIIISFIVLKFEKTKDFVIGSVLFPIFVFITSYLTKYVDFKDQEMIVIVVFAAVITGFSIGIIVKYGFSTGGSELAASVFAKVFKLSVGKTLLIIDGFIVVIGCLKFGLEKIMYATIFIYIVSILIDKIVLGISSNKAFYIITNKEEKVKEYILNKLNVGASVLKAKGGYENDSKDILFCVIPSNKYFILKEGINKIDKEAFFVATDAYEVSKSYHA